MESHFSDRPPGEPLAAPRLWCKSDQLAGPNHGLPFAERGGFHRIAYRGLGTTKFKTGRIVVPIGQRSPRHVSKLEHVITVLTGEIQFVISGNSYRLGELDQLYFPPGAEYEYLNVALRESVFLNAISAVGDWPEGPTAAYSTPAGL